MVLYIPNAEYEDVLSHISRTRLIIRVPKMYKLDLKLPQNLKDESIRAKFNTEKSRITIKIPKLPSATEMEDQGKSKEPMFDEKFIDNIRKGMGGTMSVWTWHSRTSLNALPIHMYLLADCDLKFCIY